MTSPFPGMDPYLERHWPDVHARLVHDACNSVNKQLSNDLRARIDERLVIEQDFDPVRSIYPDVRVFERGARTRPVSPAAEGVAVAEPLVVAVESEQVRETFIQIIDVSSGGRLITVIEFLSPSNKLPGDGQRKYRQKQQEVLAAGINMVEIDLTRGGERQLLYPVAQLPPGHQTTYLTCVRRGFGANVFEIYRMPLFERLPAIRVPLRESDPDAVLEIQKLVDTAYEEGRYDDTDYGEPCLPPFAPDEAARAAEFLRDAAPR